MGKILSDRTADQLLTLLNNMGRSQERRTNDPRDMQPGVGSSNNFPYDRFRVDYEGAGVRCNAGTYTCNGAEYEKSSTFIDAAGNDIDGFSAPFGPSTTFEVYLEKYHTDPYIDPTIFPEGIKIVCGTMPTDDNMRQKYWLLSTFQTDSDGYPLFGSIVWHWIGDIDELTIVPDANLDPENSIKTIKFQDGNEYELGLFGSRDLTLADASTSWDEIWGIPSLLKTGSAGDLAWNGLDAENGGAQKSIEIVANMWQLYGMDESGSALDTSGDVVMRTSAGGEIEYSTFSDFADGVYTDIESDLDARYWIQGDTYDATNYGMSIGTSTKTLAIDLDNRRLHMGGLNPGDGVATVDWGDMQLKDETDAVVMDWSFDDRVLYFPWTCDSLFSSDVGFAVGLNIGLTYNTKKLRILDEDGTPVECYAVGGILVPV